MPMMMKMPGTKPMMKIESMRSMTNTVTKTDEFFEKLAKGYDACWYDYGDKGTWFQDADLTVPALQPEDVRYVKNKSGPGHVKVERIEIDSHGRYYRDMEA
jgi:hypothetical protein